MAGQGRGQSHAPQPGRARAAQQVHQDGLGLIVGVVADDDSRGPLSVGDSGQEVIAGQSPGRFQRQPAVASQRGHAGPAATVAQPTGQRCPGHEGGLVGAVGPQAVVEMGDDEPLGWQEMREAIEQGQ